MEVRWALIPVCLVAQYFFSGTYWRNDVQIQQPLKETSPHQDATRPTDTDHTVSSSTPNSIPDTHDRLRASFLSGLVGDALCLGSHYEYNFTKIQQAYQGKDIDAFVGPGGHMGGQYCIPELTQL